MPEAEGLVRDLATTNRTSASPPRLADLAGRDATGHAGPAAVRSVVPAIWGFDPAVQLLHVDDAVGALAHAADHELAGVYNVASHRVIRWRRAAIGWQTNHRVAVRPAAAPHRHGAMGVPTACW